MLHAKLVRESFKDLCVMGGFPAVRVGYNFLTLLKMM